MRWSTAFKILFSTLILLLAGLSGIIVYEGILDKRAKNMRALFESTQVEFASEQETLGKFLSHFENFAKLMEPRLEPFQFVVADGIDVSTEKEVQFEPPSAPEPLSKRLESELLTYSTYFGQELNNPGPPGESVLDTIPIYSFRGNNVVIIPKRTDGIYKKRWTELIYQKFLELELIGDIRMLAQ